MNKNTTESNKLADLKDDICVHIFTASAAMVGVCLTVIGLFQLTAKLQKVSSIGDNLLAVDALTFLISCILSYTALRTRKSRRRYQIERIADFVFISALCLMVIVCALVAYELI